MGHQHPAAQTGARFGLPVWAPFAALDAALPQKRGVVYQNMECGNFPRYGACAGFDGSIVSQIDLNKGRATAGLADLLDRLNAHRRVEIGDEDMRAFSCQANCRCGANARRAACYQRGLALKARHAIRIGAHPCSPDAISRTESAAFAEPLASSNFPVSRTT